MGKKLIFDYTFDASAKTITVDDIYAEQRWQLITNVTDNVILYQFNRPGFGIADISFNYEAYTTTITLEYDTTSMSDNDTLQIFLDEGSSDVTVNDRFVDPVSKIRVSNPENLIDTDFEYGLQSTKWETLELTANIPTFFSRSGDFNIPIVSMAVTQGSDIVTVTTEIAHSLQRGSPIIMQGTGSVQADGGFVVGSIINDTAFTYKAKSSFISTTDIKEEFTQLFPGSVYTGTEFKLSNIGGIVTDANTASQLTVTTEYPTDFEPGTAMALSNTFAKATIPFDTDGFTVNNVETITLQRRSDLATGETNDYQLGGVSAFNHVPKDALYFTEGSVPGSGTAESLTISGNNIIFPYPHGLNLYDPITYICDPDTNTPMTGTNSRLSTTNLNSRTYFAYVINDTTIRLQTWITTSSSYTITPSYGINGGVSRSAFIKTSGLTNYYYGRFNYMWNMYSYGLDGNSTLTEFGSSTTGNRLFVTNLNDRFIGSGGAIYTSEVSDPVDNLNFSTSSYDYWAAYYSATYRVRLYYTPTSLITGRNSYSGQYIGLNRIEEENRRSSLYYANHGLNSGDFVTVTAVQGTLPSGLNSGSTYIVEKVDDNRIAFNTLSGSAINFRTGGSADLEYRLECTRVISGANTLDLPGNTLNDGDAIVYDANGGTPPAPMIDGTTYYVGGKNQDKFYISETPNVYGSSAQIDFQNSSSYVSLTPTNTVLLNSNPFTDGDAILYSSDNEITGLTSGRVYWIRTISGNTVALYNSKVDALADSNRVDLYARSTGIGTIQQYNILDITSKPSPAETHQFQADFVGAADGNYAIDDVSTDQLSFTFNAASQIEARTKTVTSQESFVASLNAFYITNHGFITGDSVTYTEAGTTNLTGLTSGTVYYIVALNKDFIGLATSEQNAIDGILIPLSETGTSASELTGTFSFQPTTIVGRFNGKGTVDFVGGSTTATGELTTFTSYFNKGDIFQINQPETTLTTAITGQGATAFTAAGHGLTTGDPIRFEGDAAPANVEFGKVYYARVVNTDAFGVHYTATDAIANSNGIALSTSGTNATVNAMTDTGSIIERTIDYVNSDEQITFTQALPATGQTDVNYLQRTSLLLRPDGFALHRPYDGGVELIPPTNPDSQMIRQTRKYFRYQSGKGIQVSFAVNFSPTSQIDTFNRVGNVGTIKTRFPHRLSGGLNITVSGATNAVDTLGTIVYNVAVVDPDGNGDKFYINGEELSSLTLYEGRTYRFLQDDSSNTGHPLRFSETGDGTHGGGVEYTTGVTTFGTPGTDGYTEITVATDAPNLFTYCTVHSGLGFAAPTPPDPDNNQGQLWNGVFEITDVLDDFTFTVTLDGVPADSEARGVVEYYVNNWANSSLRCGLFDDQNGIFFEYDGLDLYCCRRSSIRQISGYCDVEFRSGVIIGTDTKFSSQLAKGDLIVIKGQTYTITKIDSNTRMYIAPSYRGATASNVVITKTETTRVPQDQWSLDKCDGTGYTGFKLDIHKIQMAYVDYSWYGAGKVRFGFKDQHGDVRYVHSFVHGNFFTEAYMRSGNIPARYEIQNNGVPTYVPALAHWGTSVIMDGRFDSDRAYLFNATSNNLALTGVSQLTTNAKVDYTGFYYQRLGFALYPIGYAIELDSGDASLNNITTGTQISGANLDANTETSNPSSGNISPYQPYLPSIVCRQGTNRNTEAIRNLLVIDRQPTGTGTSSTYNIGAATGGEISVTKELPLISVRLAPSVDTSAPGFLGEREIINRMQLILNSVGILSTHAATIKLILNGQLSTNAWERVTNPSLSQLINHSNTDTISGGLSVYNFEVQGGTGTSARQPVLTTEALGEIATLGNSIMGGDNVYPDGPDVLTVVASLSEDPSTVSGTNPFIISGRISWSESQA